MNMKSIFSLYIFLSLVVTFGVVVQSNANTETGISQSRNEDIEDQLGIILNNFYAFLYDEVAFSLKADCKRDLFNNVMQTEVGLVVEQAYLVFTGSLFSEIFKLFLDNSVQGIQSFGESLSNVSPESWEQLRGFLTVTAMANNNQGKINKLREELTGVRLEWYFCTI